MKKWVLFLIPLMFFLGGCAGLINTQSSTLSGAVLGAPDGIAVNFDNSLPPDPTNVPEGSSVQIGLDVVNHAACEAKGTLYITDSAPSGAGGLSPVTRTFDLEGATYQGGKPSYSSMSPPYTSDNLEYKILSPTQSSTPITFQAIATYNCRILAARPSICVEPSNTQDSLCPKTEVISDPSTLRAEVGPVTVTQVQKQFSKSDNGGVQLYVTITLSKMSDGYVADSSAIENPIQGPGNPSDPGQGSPVGVSVDYGGASMDCTGSLNFKDNKIYWKSNDESEILNCKASIAADRLESQDLNVNLDYTYGIMQSKSINIQKFNQNT